MTKMKAEKSHFAQVSDEGLFQKGRKLQEIENQAIKHKKKSQESHIFS